jgi:hypothetical protein
MSTYIRVVIDRETDCILVYVASNDGIDEDMHELLFPWFDEDEFGNALEEAEAYALRLSWRLGYEINKNYGDMA